CDAVRRRHGGAVRKRGLPDRTFRHARPRRTDAAHRPGDGVGRRPRRPDRGGAALTKKGPLERAALWFGLNRDAYGITISTRRFCGSRTPSGVGTRGCSLPNHFTSSTFFGTPCFSR